ncbi:MAG: CoA-binding protein, partial [Candidatus Heimdallarchaeota archaeon]|nr:CoA-binding protein [Candidatus Heimdallarchaeota archaeon]
MINMVHQFFYPKSIAIVGATSDPKKFGNAVTANLLENDKLEAEIYPINPKATEIFGLKCYQSVLEVEKEIDLAIILVPS